jgi:hypothetical protein
LSASRPRLASYLLAARVTLALLGPLPLPRLPTPHPIVAAAPRRDDGERVRRRRGATDEIWLATLPYRAARSSTPN